MTEEAILQGLYDSGIQFDVCCCYGGGFRVRLGTPATGFSAAIIVDTHAAVVRQLAAMALMKYPESVFAQRSVSFGQSPSLVPETTGDRDQRLGADAEVALGRRGRRR